MNSVWSDKQGRMRDTEEDKKREAEALHHDALAILKQAVAEKRYNPRGVIGVFPANADEQDDIIVWNDENRDSVRAILHTLRQQKDSGGKARIALADYIAPRGTRDYIGTMAVSIHGAAEWAAELEQQDDPYRALIVSLLADRLAEAFAQYAHLKLNETWGIGAEQGIRPACGYPSQPDHQEKEIVFNLLDAQRKAGMTLTETWMMQPVSSVCALVFSHPKAAYFSVGPISQEQQENYNSRKGL